MRKYKYDRIRAAMLDMWAAGKSTGEIMETLDCDSRYISKVLQIARHRNDCRAVYRDRRAPRPRRTAFGIANNFQSSGPDVPDFIERRRIALVNAPHRDLTALIFGDPPVGFSALDKKSSVNA